MSTIYDYTAVLNNGKEISLDQYKGKVLLVVNTASACGFTPQYEGLEKLYQKYKEHGFEVLAFPCNQFGNQEKGSDEEVKNFCDLNFNISFPLFKKIEVNGEGTSPLYKHLKSHARGFLWSQKIKWNFTKFLVDKNGKVLKRYSSIVKPTMLDSAVHGLLY